MLVRAIGISPQIFPQCSAQWLSCVRNGSVGKYGFVTNTRVRSGLFLFEENPPGMPPDEAEELDEAGEPDGRWKGLKWSSDPPKKGDPERRM